LLAAPSRRSFTDDNAPQRRTAAAAEKISLKVAALPGRPRPRAALAGALGRTRN
jgi:hypothetical protein